MSRPKMKRKKDIDDQNGFSEWEGGYMGAKKHKLEEQFFAEAQNAMFKKSELFSGISIFVNGYTNPTAGELKRLMLENGGVFHHYKRPYTNFTIANNLPDVKIKAITREKIVRPSWIVDSIRENKILDYSTYLLHTNHKESQPKLCFEKVERKASAQEMTELDSIMLELESLNEQLKGNFTNPPTSELRTTSSPDLFEMEEKLFERDSNLPFHQPERQSPIDKEANGDEVVQGTPPEMVQVPPDKSNVSLPARKMARVATDPNFLAKFFQNSRLHHIATLGAEFKQHITDLRGKSNGKFAKRDNLKQIFKNVTNEKSSGTGKTIMHIDMDCFFVSVGLRRRPHLRGQPVAVTHSKGTEGGPSSYRPGMDRQQEIALYQQRMAQRLSDSTDTGTIESRLQHIDDYNSLSEIASCSYEARAKGVKNGMFVGSALKLCPDLKTIPYDFEGYKEVSHQLYDTIAQYTLDIEAVSCDEMFVDLTELLVDVGMSCEQFLTFVRNEIRTKTGCPCSTGVGANRLQARLATRKAKPDGQFCLRPADVGHYMREIQITDLPGVGRSTAHRLRQLKLETCGDLQAITLGVLQQEFGKKFGETLFQFSRGLDERPLVFGQIRKSVSVEVNYGIRFTEQQQVDIFLRQLCSELHKRLVEIRQKGKHITLKVMVRAKEAPVETAKFMGHGFCDTVSKSTSLANYTSDLEVITYNVLSLMKTMALPPSELRGIGVHVSKFPATNEGSKSSAGNVLKQMFQNVGKQKQKSKPNLDSSFVESLKQVAACVADMTMPEDVINEALRTSDDENMDVIVEQPGSPALPPMLIMIPQNQSTPSKNQPGMSEKLTRSPVSRVSIDPKPSTSRGVVGPTKRGRGRPKKIDQAKKSGSGLFNTALSRNSVPKIEQDDLAGLDPDILAELPDDIREEVIRDHKRQRKLDQINQQRKLEQQNQQLKQKQATATPPKKIEVDSEFLEALPLALRQQVEEQIRKDRDKFLVKDNSPAKAGSSLAVTTNSRHVEKVVEVVPMTQKPSEENILLQADWRQQINSWIESADAPEAYDVEMLAKNAQDLVVTKRIEQLYLFFRLLHRLTSEKSSCGWHQAYTKIVNYAQSEMYEVYKSKLRVKCSFECQNEECNSFI